MHTGTIDPDANIAKLARRVTKKCTIIPHQWIAQVEDVLVEIQERSYVYSYSEDDGEEGEAAHMDMDMNIHNDDDQELNDVMSHRDSIVDSILESFYGGVHDQILASAEILSQCRNIKNLEHFVHHQQLMSALTRIISDQSSYSIQLTLNICSVFLAISNIEDLHPQLSQFRVGSLIMKVIGYEVTRAENARGKKKKESQHHSIIHTNLLILTRLSKDESVLHKMMKKDLLGVMRDCLAMDSLAPDIQACTIFLLHRASSFSETREFCNDDGNRVLFRVMESLVEGYSSANNALGLVYNLSFDPECRDTIIASNIVECLPQLLRKSDTVNLAMGILYHLSSEEERCQKLYNADIVSILMQMVQRCIGKGLIDQNLNATLVNVR